MLALTRLALKLVTDFDTGTIVMVPLGCHLDRVS